MRGGLTPSHTPPPKQCLRRRELGIAEFMVKTLALPTFGNAHPISLILANTLIHGALSLEGAGPAPSKLRAPCDMSMVDEHHMAQWVTLVLYCTYTCAVPLPCTLTLLILHY